MKATNPQGGWDPSEAVISDPTGVLEEELLRSSRNQEWEEGYLAGRTSAALEIITYLRTLEYFLPESVMPEIKAEVAARFEELLRRIDPHGMSELVYNRLCDTRKTEFFAVALPYPVLPSSSSGTPPATAAPSHDTHGPHQERRSLGPASPSSEG